jgi:hypothetical protein
MRPIANKMVSGLACLAALLTPASGISHFVCRCPNGHLKSFCLNITTENSGGCCCGGGCCSRAGGGKCCCCSRGKTARCARHDGGANCCRTPQARAGEERAGGPSFDEGPCCTKALRVAQSLVVFPKRGPAADDVRPSGDWVAGPVLVCTPEAGSGFGVPGLAHSPGPPADLVTLLRRLVI